MWIVQSTPLITSILPTISKKENDYSHYNKGNKTC